MDEKKDKVVMVEDARQEDCVSDEAPDPEDEVFEKHSEVVGRDGVTKGKLVARLPAFDIGRHSMAFAAGLKREAERKEEERLREEKKRREYREKRERKTAMFVTPGLPPLAMAPDIDPEYLEELVCSDEQARRLFPNDPAKQCAIKDLQGEYIAVKQYHSWLYKQRFGPDGKSSGELARCGFYEKLLHEVRADDQEVLGEYSPLMASATTLGRFEFHNLDKDGGTTRLETRLSEGEYLNDEDDPIIQAAYHELWIKYPRLERFEKRWGLDKGIEELEERLRGFVGERLFYREPEEVKRRYGYLLDRIKEEEGTSANDSEIEHDSWYTTEGESLSGSSENAQSSDDEQQHLADEEEMATGSSSDNSRRRSRVEVL